MQGADTVNPALAWNCRFAMYVVHASMFIMLCLPTNRDTVNAEAVGWLAPGVLLYFVDGVLPLLRVSSTKS